MAGGNITVNVGSQVLAVLPVEVTLLEDPILLAGVVYKYANLDLPFSPNDPGLQYTYTGTLVSPIATGGILTARFFNLIGEYSPRFIIGGGAVIPINPPIIFEPPLRMCLSGLPEIWIVASDIDPNYGGCWCYQSSDAGLTYNPAKDLTGNPIIYGSATTGYTVNDFPAHEDVDGDDPLIVDLTESNGAGTLVPYILADEDKFRYPCYVSASGARLSTDPGWVTSVSGQAGYSFFAGIEPSDTVNFQTPESEFNFVAAHSRGPYMSLWGGIANSASGTIVVSNDVSSCVPLGDCANTSTLSPYKIGTINFLPNCGTCNGSSPAAVGADGNIISETSGFFLYDLESISAGIVNTGGYAGFVTQSFFGKGIPVGPLTFDDVTFPENNQLAWQSVNFAGSGGAIGIVKMLPTGIGHALYIAFVMGALNFNAPNAVPGWTLIASGTVCSVWAAHGQAVITPQGGPYELIHYRNVLSVSGNEYFMPCAANSGDTGGPIRRAVFSMPIPGFGTHHVIGSRFAWLNDRLSNKPKGIIKIPLDAAWIGHNLLYRFPAFSQSGGVEKLKNVATYSYTPTGLAFAQFSPQPTYIQTPLRALTQVDANTITMARVTEDFAGNLIKYNARTFNIPTPPVLGQTYYITIFDPYRLGDIGTALTRPSFIDTTQNRLLTTGYIYVGSVVAIPSAFGTALITPGGWPPGQVFLVNGI